VSGDDPLRCEGRFLADPHGQAAEHVVACPVHPEVPPQPDSFEIHFAVEFAAAGPDCRNPQAAVLSHRPECSLYRLVRALRTAASPELLIGLSDLLAKDSSIEQRLAVPSLDDRCPADPILLRVIEPNARLGLREVHCVRYSRYRGCGEG